MELNQLKVGLVLLDRQKKIRQLDRTAEEVLGGPASQLTGRYLQTIWPGWSETEECWQTMERGGKTILAQAVLGDHEPHLIMLLLVEASGIKQVVQELEELRSLNKELLTIFNASFDEFYVTDGQGKTVHVSAACKEYYGITPDQLIGKHVKDLEREGLFFPSVTDLVINEKQRVTLKQTTRTGKQLIVTGNPVFDCEGNVVRVVVNSRDTTELNNLRQKLRDTEKLAASYRSELIQLRKDRSNAVEIIASSPQMQQIKELIHKVTQVDSTVLVMGESGVGKSVIASQVHHNSKRCQGDFVTINCGAIPENLLEAELFGYEGGAFTGARKEGKEGLIELADGGTLFLDEITELPLNLQVKLLEVLQERRLKRVGGTKSIDVDLRIIAATNRDLQTLVHEGKFREDLYYRLNVIPVVVPPLRHRREDIEPLIRQFCRRYNEKYGMNRKISPEALELMLNYRWPGNVREVENIIERLMVTVEDYVIEAGHLPRYFHDSRNTASSPVYVSELCTLKEATEELEQQLLKKACERFQNTYRMAEALGVNQSTVVRKLNKYQLHLEDVKNREDNHSFSGTFD